jgi:hypothetical protein
MSLLSKKLEQTGKKIVYTINRVIFIRIKVSIPKLFDLYFRNTWVREIITVIIERRIGYEDDASKCLMK